MVVSTICHGLIVCNRWVHMGGFMAIVGIELGMEVDAPGDVVGVLIIVVAGAYGHGYL